jgi:hypothetical protein
MQTNHRPARPHRRGLAPLAAAALALAALVAPVGRSSAEPPAPTIPASVFTDTPAKDAKGVTETMRTAKKGERVVVEATLGGRAEPFVRSRAVFVVADRALKACGETGDHGCKTPWDYCCEPAERKKTGLATIEIADKDGRILKVSAQGAGGLEPLVRLVVEGTVREIDAKGLLVIRAERIHVVPADKPEDRASPAPGGR